MTNILNAEGYTLIEIVLVLFIVGLLSGLAVPRLTTIYDNLQVAFTRDEIFAQLSHLSYQAFHQARDLTLTTYPLQKQENTQDSLPLELPVGWQIQAKEPILFHANGVCTGGTVYLYYQNLEFRVQLTPPFCQL